MELIFNSYAPNSFAIEESFEITNICFYFREIYFLWENSFLNYEVFVVKWQL